MTSRDATLDLSAIALLSALAQARTLRHAALRLGAPKSTVARHLAELEARLGAPVFLRHGRSLKPTRFGDELLAKATPAAKALQELEHVAREAAQLGDLRLTIAVAPSFAELVLGPVLEQLARRHPRLAVELLLTHDRAAVFDERIDVALRRGPIPDSDSLVSRKLGRTTLVAVGVERFASDEPAPTHVAGLPWIRVGARLEPFELELRGPKLRRNVVVRPQWAMDSQRLALELVRRGLGVARLNRSLVHEHLVAGELVEVVPSARSVAETVVLHPRGSRKRPIIRELIELLLATAATHSLFDG